MSELDWRDVQLRLGPVFILYFMFRGKYFLNGTLMLTVSSVRATYEKGDYNVRLKF